LISGVDRQIRVVLASASPARLRTLRAAGLDPEVIISGVDETAVVADRVPEMVAELAEQKAEAVLARLDRVRRPTLIIGCDSMLELDGQPYGKPSSASAAVERWRQMSGRSGVLHTGHHVIMNSPDTLTESGRLSTTDRRTAVAATTIHFAKLSLTEIEAYVATGEPLTVAGAFTIDGLGGAFVTGIEGDHSNVLGVSLPLLRGMIADLGIPWPLLWR
jgi:septum formation protein